jgi:glutamate dehydrogenase (NAD(P)+)
MLQNKSYIPSSDLGTTEEDIRFMLIANGIEILPRSLTYSSLSGFYTGITVFAAAVRAARHVGAALNRASVAIEGFGNVGSSAAQAFWENGVRVVAISTSRGAIYDESGLDIGELIKLSNQVGSQVVKFFPRGEKLDRTRLAELDVDIFCPCAHSDSINMNNAARLAARIVCPGANAPIAPEAEQILFQRGILAVPDFVADCGGVLGISMKRAGINEDHIRRFLERTIGDQATQLIEAAEKDNITPRVYAEKIAEQRFSRAKAAAEKRTIMGKTFNLALELYRKGIIPYQLVTPVALWYFGRRFKQIQFAKPQAAISL